MSQPNPSPVKDPTVARFGDGSARTATVVASPFVRSSIPHRGQTKPSDNGSPPGSVGKLPRWRTRCLCKGRTSGGCLGTRVS